MELIFIIIVGYLWYLFSDSGSSSNNYQNTQHDSAPTTSRPSPSSTQPKVRPAPKRQPPNVRKATVPSGQSVADRKAIVDSQLKQNYQRYLNYLRQNGIQYLYHFTDRSNIESIKRVGGLISWEEANRRGLTIPRPGGDTLSRQLDSRKNLGNYVRLCFHPDHPMKFIARTQGRMPNPVILKIKLPVAALKNTLYSDVNAAASYAQIGGDYASLQRINFDVINSGTWVDEAQKHQFQAEVMVHRFVNIANIINIG